VTTTEELTQVLRDRREKLDELIRRGIRPFEYNFHRTHLSAAAVELFASAERGAVLDGDIDPFIEAYLKGLGGESTGSAA